jgi:hypothetical protein
MGAAVDRWNEAEGLVDRFLRGRSVERAQRLRSELQRIARAGGDLDLERLELVSPSQVTDGIQALRERYAKDTVQTSAKVFKAYVRFAADERQISPQTSKELQAAAALDRAPRDFGSMFPQLVEECDRLPSPRCERDIALAALWAGTKLSWRKLAALSLEDYRAMPKDEALRPWVEAWLRVRGDRPGYLLCKIVGDAVLPDEGNNEASLRGLVGSRVDPLAPDLSASERRRAAAKSFGRWMTRRR